MLHRKVLNTAIKNPEYGKIGDISASLFHTQWRRMHPSSEMLGAGNSCRQEARKQSQHSAMAPYVIVPLKYLVWCKKMGKTHWRSEQESQGPKAMDEAERPQERKEIADETTGWMLVLLVNAGADGLFSVLALVTGWWVRRAIPDLEGMHPAGMSAPPPPTWPIQPYKNLLHCPPNSVMTATWDVSVPTIPQWCGALQKISVTCTTL